MIHSLTRKRQEKEQQRARMVARGGAGRGRAGPGRCAESGPGGRTGQRVRTDPEPVEVALIMLSQLLTRVTGSEPGPVGHSSLSGIARSKVQGR